jgi:oligopeptide transport system substrate-binding protein
MSSKKLILFLVIAVLMALVAACGGAAQTETVTKVETVIVEKEVQGETVTVVETVVVEKEVEVEKVVTVEVEKEVAAEAEDPNAGRITLDTVIGTEPPTIDPALGTDSTSIFFIRQMFVGLTGFDEEAQVVPSLATEWDVSEDGLVWTYKLRDDIHWVHRDPNSGEFEDIGPVTAQDVVYGVTRTLDPGTASDYAYVLYLLAGAEAFNTADPGAENFEDLRAAVGVKAVDDTTVEFTLTSPAAYFPSITGLWITFPQPQAAIEEWGENWTEAGLIVTNGPYTLQNWTHGSEIWIEKNPLWVDADSVQIELVGGPIIQEESTTMALYENNEIDIMASPPGWGPPLPDMDRIKSDPQLSEELFIAPQLCTYYYGFLTTKPPFDDVLVRKAFTAAIDRQDVVENITKGEQIPAHSFAPPGIFGTVADNMEIGAFMVQDDYASQVTQAQEWLAEAGYPEGEGIDIILGHNTSEAHAQIAQAIQAMWQEAFPQANITIENQEWAVYLETLDPTSPDEEKPNVFRNGWCADYPDSNNWLNEVFNSKSGQNWSKFNNPEFDALVEEAAFEAEPEKRQELYTQAESILVDQEVAMAPIYYYTYVRMYKPWITPVVSPVSGDPIAEWKIDWEAKQAARGQ